jgi:hypothetical protein
MYQVCVPLQKCLRIGLERLYVLESWENYSMRSWTRERRIMPARVLFGEEHEQSAPMRYITSIFRLFGNNCLSLESEPLGTLPVLSQQLPNLGTRSKVDLQNISRVRVLVLNLSLACQFRMSSNNVHLIQVLSSETWDGWVLHLGSVDITDNLAFRVVTNDSSVFESCDPEITDSVHC